MYISYFDEAGDDGFPETSSPIFVLSSLYMDHNEWKNNFEQIRQFKRKLKDDYGMPVKEEFHTTKFLTDKNPYHGQYENKIRKEILYLYFNLISSLSLKIINVVIDKSRFTSPGYPILEKALTYNVQRIENDLSVISKKYLIITDEGRLGKMRKQIRKIQRINFIPSKFNQYQYRKEISNLIEDPLSKESSESYFIQLADAVATIVYLYSLQNLCKEKLEWANRVKKVLSYGNEIELLQIIENNLNLAASSIRFGLVCYPR